MTVVRVESSRRAFFTPRTLAQYLSLGQTKVFELLRDGVIPSYRISGSRRIDPHDVDAYLATCKENHV